MDQQNTSSVPLKPLLPIFTIIEKAWKSYKNFFKKLWPLCLATVGAGALAIIAFEAVFMLIVLSDMRYGGFPSGLGIMYSALFILVYIFISFFLTILLGGMADMYKGDYQGLRIAYARGIKSFLPFVVLNIAFVLVMISGTYLFLVPGIAFFVYLAFCKFEFFVEGKRGFDALLGSWSLVKGRWWMIFGKFLLAGLLLGAAVYIAEIAFIIVFGILAALLASVHLEILIIIIGILFALAFVAVLILLVYPLVFLVYFELYFNLKETQIAANIADEKKNKSRKILLVVFMVIGILAVTIVPIFMNYQIQKLQASFGAEQNMYQQRMDDQVFMPQSTNATDTNSADINTDDDPDININ